MENWELLSKIRQRLDALHRERSAVGHKIAKRDARIYELSLAYLYSAEEHLLAEAQELKQSGAAETHLWTELTKKIKAVESLLE